MPFQQTVPAGASRTVVLAQAVELVSEKILRGSIIDTT